MDTTLALRPALPMDKGAILDLSRDIWDGGDYLPYVLDDWLRDPGNLLMVGEFGPRLAAVARTIRQLPDTWWFEGMRVHPDFEGRGISTRMMGYLMDFVRKQGARQARLVTSSQRLAVHHICAKMGWDKIAEVAHYRAAALAAGEPAPFQAMAVEDTEEAMAAAVGWQDPAAFNGMMDLGWEWVDTNPSYLGLAIQEGRAWWWEPQGQRKGLLTAWYNDERAGGEIMIELAACAPGELADLLMDYRRLAGQMGQAEAGGNLAVLAAAETAAAKAGFKRNWEKSLYVFEVRF